MTKSSYVEGLQSRGRALSNERLETCAVRAAALHGMSEFCGSVHSVMTRARSHCMKIFLFMLAVASDLF